MAGYSVRNMKSPLRNRNSSHFGPRPQGGGSKKPASRRLSTRNSAFELDVFSGSLVPLVMVEVEFASVMAANGFVPPDWFGADGTNGARFKNKTFAIHDLSDLSHPVLLR